MNNSNTTDIDCNIFQLPTSKFIKNINMYRVFSLLESLEFFNPRSEKITNTKSTKKRDM